MKTEDIWLLVLPRLRRFLAATDWNFQFIADSTRARPSTVGEWLVNKQPPVGVRLITLWHLMSFAGIPSPELDELLPFNRYLGELVALSVISMEDACEVLNVKNEQTALQALRGSPPMRPRLSLDELSELYGEMREQKLADLPVLAHEPMQAAEVKPAVKPSTAEPKRPKANPTAANAVISLGFDRHVLLATLLGAASPLMRDMVEPDDPTERNKFRAFFGQDNILPLLNALTALTSERARDNRR